MFEVSLVSILRERYVERKCNPDLGEMELLRAILNEETCAFSKESEAREVLDILFGLLKQDIDRVYAGDQSTYAYEIAECIAEVAKEFGRLKKV